LRAVLLVDEFFFDRTDPNFASRQWPKDAEAEFSVSDALRSLGHEVIGVPATVDIVETINNIKAAKPDFVFNMVEEIGGRREYDSLIVRILELMNIPYTGASSDALMLGRNKYLSKLMVADVGVLVPKGVVISGDKKVSPGDLSFPAIVKPMYGDGSDGITSKSYVKNSAALQLRISQLMRWSPLLCEEYVPGREIIVTISGTKTITVDSICEMVFPENSPIKFATDRVKFDGEYRDRFGIFYRTPTRLAPAMKAKVLDAAKTAYRALRINAYAKLEFRVSDERVVFIEANPNSQMSRFAKSTDFASIGYEKFIRKIIRMALNRKLQ
jgi:D-alanine-D-alanine ligase